METSSVGAGLWPPKTNDQSIDALFEQMRELRAQIGVMEARIADLHRTSEALAKRLTNPGGER